jgi:hypothetical protein
LISPLGKLAIVRSAQGLIEKLPEAAQMLADATYDIDKFCEF